MKKAFTILGMALFTISLFIFPQPDNPKVQESITFFPIDPKVKYKNVETSLGLINRNKLLWSITSTLDRKAYLRQDAGLLYANGKLMDEVHEWRQNTNTLTQKKSIASPNSTHFDAITFHHAELHENGEQIFSSQAMSGDQLYVITSGTNSPYSFRVPETQEEINWKQKLDQNTDRMLRYSWNKGIKRFSIHLSDYQAYPLNQFNSMAKNILPGFTEEETEKTVGNLWEGLYKNYLLGFKKTDGTVISPIGSTIPLILIAKNKSHLLVLTEAANGEPILLRQRIGYSD